MHELKNNIGKRIDPSDTDAVNTKRERFRDARERMSKDIEERASQLAEVAEKILGCASVLVLLAQWFVDLHLFLLVLYFVLAIWKLNTDEQAIPSFSPGSTGRPDGVCPKPLVDMLDVSSSDFFRYLDSLV